MSWWYEQLLGSLVCALVASCTWGLMVWMGEQISVKQWGWLQGLMILGTGNGLLWFILTLVQPGLALWLFLFLSLNGMLGYFLTQLPLIAIPNLWAMVLHPIGISLMVTLLGGATSKF